MTARRNLAVVLVSVFAFLAVNLATLRDGHNWGGDFSQYIKHAQNVLEGRAYAVKTHPPEGRETLFQSNYPPGFPLLLAPVLALAGMDFPLLKSMNVGFWLLYAFAVKALLGRRLGETAGLVGFVLVLSSPTLFAFKQNVWPDLPFVFFTTVALHQFTIYIEDPGKDTRGRFAVAAAAVAAPLLVRTAGVAIFAAAAIHLLAFKRRPAPAGALVAIAAGVIAAQQGLGTSAAGYLDQLVALESWLAGLPFAILYTFAAIGDFFVAFKYLDDPAKTLLMWAAVAGVVAAVTARGAVLWLGGRSSRIEFIDLFTAAYFAMIVLWSYQQGARYVFPVVAPVMIYAIEAGRPLLRRLGSGRARAGVLAGLLALALAYNATATARLFRFDDDVVRRPETRAMIEWVQRHTAPADTILFVKPRVLSLLTGRTVIGVTYPPNVTWTVLLDRAAALELDWLVVDRWWPGEEAVRRKIAADPGLCAVWRNARFEVYAFRPCASPGARRLHPSRRTTITASSS